MAGPSPGAGQPGLRRELVSRGAARVYGAARDPAAVNEPGVLPVALDITDPAQVARVAMLTAVAVGGKMLVMPS